MVTNSDLESNIDYRLIFSIFIEQDADLAVLSIPYQVSIPCQCWDKKMYSEVLGEPTYLIFNGGWILFDENVKIYSKHFSSS
jgi:hypothetical protein